MHPDSSRARARAGVRHRPAIVAAVLMTMGLSEAIRASAAERSPADLMDALMWNREPVGGPFALIDHTGRPRTHEDFRGRFLLIYFGFTYCPDICPTDLQAMSQAVDELGPAGEAVQPLFITVDPERDTAEHLAEYVPSFHPRLVGLTGAPEAIRQAADAYKVYYSKASPSGGTDYTVEHSAFIYLVGPNGEYRGFFPPGTSADRLLYILRQHLNPL